MTKKHFEAIAAILVQAELTEGWHTEAKHGGKTVTVYIAYHLADYFATINPNFDYKRFLQAAGIDSY